MTSVFFLFSDPDQELQRVIDSSVFDDEVFSDELKNDLGLGRLDDSMIRYKMLHSLTHLLTKVLTNKY